MHKEHAKRGFPHYAGPFMKSKYSAEEKAQIVRESELRKIIGDQSNSDADN